MRAALDAAAGLLALDWRRRQVAGALEPAPEALARAAAAVWATPWALVSRLPRPPHPCCWARAALRAASAARVRAASREADATPQPRGPGRAPSRAANRARARMPRHSQSAHRRWAPGAEVAPTLSADSPRLIDVSAVGAEVHPAEVSVAPAPCRAAPPRGPERRAPALTTR